MPRGRGMFLFPIFQKDKINTIMKNFQVSKKVMRLLVSCILLSFSFVVSAHHKISNSYKPRLYAFVAGFTPPNILWTENDAMDIANALRTQSGMFYSGVFIEQLTGDEATAVETEKRLKKFVKLNDIRPSDIFLLFMSSHGRQNGIEYSLQASDYEPLSSERTSINISDLMCILGELKAKKLVFIDACESGKGISALLKNAKKRNDRTVQKCLAKSDYTFITSSIGDSYHHRTWKNGAFTEALLEGLKGKADINADEHITTNEIYEYVHHRVPQLCKEQSIKDMQEPDYGGDLKDFPFYTVSKTNIKQEDTSNTDADTVSISNLGIIYESPYTLIVKPKTEQSAQKWEQKPIPFFHHTQNDIRYVEGKAAFMGTQGKLGLRIEIAIMGDATEYFGNKAPEIVIGFENKKTFNTFNKYPMYKCVYDTKQNKTFYRMVYDISNKQRKLLHSQKINSVSLIWEGDRETYDVLNKDAFIRQLDNIIRAERDNIIENKYRKVR